MPVPPKFWPPEDSPPASARNVRPETAIVAVPDRVELLYVYMIMDITWGPQNGIFKIF